MAEKLSSLYVEWKHSFSISIKDNNKKVHDYQIQSDCPSETIRQMVISKTYGLDGNVGMKSINDAMVEACMELKNIMCTVEIAHHFRYY